MYVDLRWTELGCPTTRWYATIRLESRPMSRFYDIDDANATLSELGRDPRRRSPQQRSRAGPAARRGPGRRRRRRRAGAGHDAGRVRRAPIANDLRLTRLRMQGLIDQMAAGVARIDALGLDPARHRARPGRLPGPRHRAPGLAVLAARRGRRSAAGTTSTRASTGGDRWPSWRDRRAPSSSAAMGAPRPTGHSPRPIARRRWRPASRPTSAATSSRRTSCWSRPGWARTCRPIVPCSRA